VYQQILANQSDVLKSQNTPALEARPFFFGTLKNRLHDFKLHRYRNVALF